MKKFLKSLLIATLILTTVGMAPADTYARRYVFIRPSTAVSYTYSLVQSSGDVFGSSGGTTGNKDTRTANLIVVCLWYHAGTAANISDNQGNTYTGLTAKIDNNQGSKCYYKINPTTSATHTFTTTSHFVGVGVQSWKSTGTPVFDQESGFAQNASGNIQPGSLTPSVNNSIAITSMGAFNGAAPTTPSGYTSTANNTTSTAEAGGMAYVIQTTATATNPTWNGTGSSETAVLAIFKPN